jgi:hypothetical protein
VFIANPDERDPSPETVDDDGLGHRVQTDVLDAHARVGADGRK